MCFDVDTKSLFGLSSINNFQNCQIKFVYNPQTFIDDMENEELFKQTGSIILDARQISQIRVQNNPEQL